MTFTDITFLFIFLPVALLLYYFAAGRGKEVILLIMSLLFYACGSAEYFFLLLVSLIVNIMLGCSIKRLREKKIVAVCLLVTGILFSIAILGYYKYADFAIDITNQWLRTSFEAKNLLLPLGLSFYTFKAISYLVDVYKGKIYDNNPLTVALCLSFFGQIQSGPIARYDTFKNTERVKEPFFEGKGVTRFLQGFGKKILLANVLSNVVIEIFDNTVELSTPLAWLGAVCYSLQLYYDFSGYSDMAVGISALFGYECPKNFNYPYMTKSIAEFWRRWHITLGAWFRDYVYIPMGGSRVGKVRLYINLLVVWLLTGLWHGANWNFIAWGLGYFLLISFEKAVNLPKCLKSTVARISYRVFTLLFINFQWVMFRSAGIKEGFMFIKTMIVPTSNEIATARAEFLMGDYIVFIIIAIIFAVPLVPKLQQFFLRKRVTELGYHIIYGIVTVVIFMLALSLVIGGQNNPFLYANF